MSQFLGKYQTNSFSDTYPERPIWSLMAGNTSYSSANLITFGVNPYVNIGFETAGTPNAHSWKMRPTTEELAVSGWNFAGRTATVQTTEGVSLSNGNFGCWSSSQTCCLNNFEVYSNAYWGFSATYSTKAEIASRSSVVIGSSNFCQNFDLFMNNYSVWLDYIGAPWNAQDSTSMNYMTNVTTITGWQSRGTLDTTNIGMMCYNRNNNKIAILQAVSGSATLYRLHVLSLGNQFNQSKISASMPNQLLNILLGNAIVLSYKYYDITLPAPTNTTVAETRTKIKVVYCDDDTVWFVRNDIPETSGTIALQLYSISTPLGASGTTPTVNTISSQAGSSVAYGYGTASGYGMRHMMSDDNSRIAVYVPNYYYSTGIRMFVMNTASAATTTDYLSFNHLVTSGGQWSIAPAGNKKFVLGDSGVNADGAAAQLYFLDTVLLAGVTKTPGNTISLYYPIPSTSTLYGAGS